MREGWRKGGNPSFARAPPSLPPTLPPSPPPPPPLPPLPSSRAKPGNRLVRYQIHSILVWQTISQNALNCTAYSLSTEKDVNLHQLYKHMAEHIVVINKNMCSSWNAPPMPCITLISYRNVYVKDLHTSISVLLKPVPLYHNEHCHFH